MSVAEMIIKQNKAKLGVTVSSWVKKKAEEYSETEEFGSMSNFVETALTYFIGALDKEKELKQKDVDDKIKQLQTESHEATSVLIKLLSRHPELLSEIDDEHMIKNK